MVWTLVLRNLGIAVFRGEGALVGVKHVLCFGDVRHFVGEVIRRGVPWLSDFVPEPGTSPGWAKGGARSAETKFLLKVFIRHQ